MSNEHYGGYEYIFVDKVHDRYICHVCTKPLRAPHLTTCCGQHYCETCLSSWLKKQQKGTCPHCRAEGDEFQHVLDKKLSREIRSLNVYCTFQEEGCKWTGHLELVRGHIQESCGYVNIECPNKCEGPQFKGYMKVKRCDLDMHLKEKCYLRPYQCEHCGLKGTYQSIVGDPDDPHDQICPEFPLSCHYCNENIKRKDLNSHCSQCPLKPVPCPFREAGCDSDLVRKGVSEHVTANQEKHILNLMHLVLEMKQEQEELKRTLSTELNFVRKATTGKKQISYALASLQSHLLPQILTRNKSNKAVFRMTDFSRYAKSGKLWYSPHFYCNHLIYKNDGYKMCLSIQLKGIKKKQPGYLITLSVILLNQQNASLISWPFWGCNARLQVEVVKQTNGGVMGGTLCLPCECRHIGTVGDSQKHKLLTSIEVFLPRKFVKRNGMIYKDPLLFKTSLIFGCQCPCSCHNLTSSESSLSESSIISESSSTEYSDNF